MPILSIPVSDETREFGLAQAEKLSKAGKRLNGRPITTDVYLGWALDRVVEELAEYLEQAEADGAEEQDG